MSIASEYGSLGLSLLFETDGGGKGGFGSQQGSRSTQPFFGSALRTASPESAVWDFNAASAHDGWCQSLSEPSNPFPPNMNPLPPALYEIFQIYENIPHNRIMGVLNIRGFWVV